MTSWLYKQWPYALIFAVPFLLVLLPFWSVTFGLPLTLVYLQLPIYMLHQIEEHYGDRFRTYFNAQIGHGRELLTPAAVFWINSLGIWVLDIILLYLSFFVDLSWSLPMIYIAVLNGITHIMATVRSRRYNPGLCTSIFLFLPLGIWSACVISAASHATWYAHALGVAAAILLHLLIIAYIFRPKKKDQGLPATP